MSPNDTAKNTANGASNRAAKQGWIDAAEAARMLDVSRATLYAYVSRGFVRSRAAASASTATRERRYSREDVERLRRRTEERRAPDKAAARALQWGMPILESSITLTDGRRLYYRGLDAAMLARARSREDGAAVLGTGARARPRTRATEAGQTRAPLR